MNKEVCKRCWLGLGFSEEKWEEDAKYFWDNGMVLCVYAKSDLNRIKIRADDEAPSFCPYALEHVLLEDE